MSTISALERIRLRIEAEVQSRVIERILDVGVVYHSRRGIRPGCDCEWCQAKRYATFKIGNMAFRRFNSREEVDYARAVERAKHRRILNALL